LSVNGQSQFKGIICTLPDIFFFFFFPFFLQSNYSKLQWTDGVKLFGVGIRARGTSSPIYLFIYCFLLIFFFCQANNNSVLPIPELTQPIRFLLIRHRGIEFFNKFGTMARGLYGPLGIK